MVFVQESFPRVSLKFMNFLFSEMCFHAGLYKYETLICESLGKDVYTGGSGGVGNATGFGSVSASWSAGTVRVM